MEAVMIRVLNMSFAAGCTAFEVIVWRGIMKKFPKKYGYWLWMAVLFRFLCPVVLTAPVSLLPVNPKPIGMEIVYTQKPKVETGVIWLDRAVNQTVMNSLAPVSEDQSVNPIQIVLAIAFVLWILGMAVFFCYHLWQWVKLQRICSASRNQGTMEQGKQRIAIRASDQISGAFTMGILYPVIYLPSDLEPEEQDLILHHELVHIRRRDGLVKILWIGALMIHWFHPMAWLSFRGMCKDMEMSCDEQVIFERGQKERVEYSKILLKEAERRNRCLLPLAFGKHSAYQRIKNILSYHKPGKGSMAAGALIGTVVIIGLLVSGNSNLPKEPGSGKDVKKSQSPGQQEENQGEESKMGETSDTTVIIGGADGPTSIFIAGKVGADDDREDPLQSISFDWLSSVKLLPHRAENKESSESVSENEQVSRVYLDAASEDLLMFHGAFGLFSFSKDADGCWHPDLFYPNEGEYEALFTAIQKSVPKAAASGDGIHKEDRFLSGGAREDFVVSGWGNGGWNDNQDFDVLKMEDGRIAVLGGRPSGDGTCFLRDLWYGYYDPDEQVMRQVFLFLGDGKELVNEKGQISQCMYLFSREDYTYLFRSPRTLLEFEQKAGEGKGLPEASVFSLPYGRMELVRYQNGNEEILDPLACMQSWEQQKVVLTEERLIYTAAAQETLMDFKNPGLTSICFDGRNRQTANILYQVYDGLSYADGWLYYEGWTNDQEFPRPLMRMKPDFSGQQQMGLLTGSLLAVLDGGACWQLDWDQNRIMVSSVEDLENQTRFLADGEDGKYQHCEMETIGDELLQITISPLEPLPEEAPLEVRQIGTQMFKLRIPKGKG